MPPRSTTATNLSALIDSDSDSDFDKLEAAGAQVAGNSAKAMSAPRARGRPPAHANRVSKPAQRGGRGASTAAARSALTDKKKSAPRTAKHDAGTQDEEDPFVEDDSPRAPQSKSPPKRGRPKATRGTTRGALSQARPGRGRPPKAKPQAVEEDFEGEITEHMEVDEQPDPEPEVEDDVVEEASSEEEASPEPELPEAPPATNGSALKARHIPSLERNSSDAVVRRQLGEMKKRYESLEARHNELKEVGVRAAERNYEKLKKKADESSAIADKMIAELKAELASQKQLTKRLEQSEADRRDLESEVTALNGSLTSARTEIKTLTTKLAAARNADAGPKVPGSALKPSAAGKQAASVEAVQAAQAKEDLYCDLTGLIIRGIKYEDEEDVFDCIQTGRNGTLHFKLALDATGADDNYEDVQYTYRPQLEASRDGDLVELLPDYLQEEIDFPRNQASKFMLRVSRSLMERVD